MEAILIDAKKQMIYPVQVDPDAEGSHVQSIRQLVGCDTFTCVSVGKNDIYVDDEGLFKITPSSVFFLYDGYRDPIHGNGLIMGVGPMGESIPPTITAMDAARNVRFMNLSEVQLYAKMNNQ